MCCINIHLTVNPFTFNTLRQDFVADVSCSAVVINSFYISLFEWITIISHII